MQLVALGLGSNKGDRIKNLRLAIQYLVADALISVIKKSAVFQTTALLKPNAPKEWEIDYFNCCILIETAHNPVKLLAILKSIELNMGRDLQAARWSPRVIDIDIITWGDLVIEKTDLQIPHIGLLERNFVLQPLLQVNPSWVHPKQPDLNLHMLLKKFPALPYAPYQLDHPKIMGILNISGDSFSGDGIEDISKIESQFLSLVNQGAEIIDIGAVSTKPSAKEISVEEEWQRLKPICCRIVDMQLHPNLMTRPKISIDTSRPEIVAKLRDYPINIINDVYGNHSQEICGLIKDTSIKYCLMHNCGRAGKQYLEINQPAIDQVFSFFEQKKKELLGFGLKQDQLIFDIGVGFGKFPFQVENLFENLHQFKSLGVEIMVGHSRKASISESTNTLSPTERDFETATISHQLKNKVNYLRVHNVELTRRAIFLD